MHQKEREKIVSCHSKIAGNFLLLQFTNMHAIFIFLCFSFIEVYSWPMTICMQFFNSRNCFAFLMFILYHAIILFPFLWALQSVIFIGYLIFLCCIMHYSSFMTVSSCSELLILTSYVFRINPSKVFSGPNGLNIFIIFSVLSIYGLPI